MLILAGDQHGRPGLLDDLGECFDLQVVDDVDFPVLVVARTGGELEQLAHQHCGVGGGDGLLLLELQDQVSLEVSVLFLHVLRHRDLDILHHGIGDILQPVAGAQGDGDVVDAVLDGSLGTVVGCPVVLHVVGRMEEIALEQLEVLAEALPVVQQPDLPEEVHEAVGCRGAGQGPPSAGQHGCHFLFAAHRDAPAQGVDALGRWVLRLGGLVEDDRVVG